jgi:hypothetical protein
MTTVSGFEWQTTDSAECTVLSVVVLETKRTNGHARVSYIIIMFRSHQPFANTMEPPAKFMKCQILGQHAVDIETRGTVQKARRQFRGT